MKKCTLCKIKKSTSEFPKDKSRKDGIGYTCKLCKRKYDLINYKENKKSILKKIKNGKIHTEEACKGDLIFVKEMLLREK